MNGALSVRNSHKGVVSMKKMLFIVSLCAVLVLGFATTAYAYGWEDWDATANAGSLLTPHRDYQLTTEKCAVCHAAHNTSPSTESELLLRSSIANACTYCHIDSNVGVKQVYNAQSSAYNDGGAFDTNNYAHNAVYGYSCSSCHSVHAASTYDTNYDNVDTKILRMYPAGSEHEQQSTVPAAWGTTGTRDQAVSAFCTQCHGYYATDGQTAVEFHGGTTGYTHPMIAADDAFTPALSAGSTVAYTGKVAWTGSDSCRQCHDAGTDGVDDSTGVILSSFPHYTPGAEQFLQGALYAGAAQSDSADGDYDGVCLKCHKGSATSGVGFDF